MARTHELFEHDADFGVIGRAKEAACRLQDEYDGALEKGKIAYDKLLVRLRDLEAKAERKARDLRGGSGAPA